MIFFKCSAYTWRNDPILSDDINIFQPPPRQVLMKRDHRRGVSHFF